MLSSAESASKGDPHDHTPARSEAPETPRDSSSAAAAGSRLNAPSLGSAAHDAWPEQHMRESGMHAVGAVVAVRAELMALLHDLPALVRAYLVLYVPLKSWDQELLPYVTCT